MEWFQGRQHVFSDCIYSYVYSVKIFQNIKNKIMAVFGSTKFFNECCLTWDQYIATFLTIRTILLTWQCNCESHCMKSYFNHNLTHFSHDMPWWTKFYWKCHCDIFCDIAPTLNHAGIPNNDTSSDRHDLCTHTLEYILNRLSKVPVKNCLQSLFLGILKNRCARGTFWA